MCCMNSVKRMLPRMGVFAKNFFVVIFFFLYVLLLSLSDNRQHCKCSPIPKATLQHAVFPSLPSSMRVYLSILKSIECGEKKQQKSFHMCMNRKYNNLFTIHRSMCVYCKSGKERKEKYCGI